MSNIEHYFENLLFHGEDCQGEPNKKGLSQEVVDAIETCAAYLQYSVFCGPEECQDFMRATIEGSVVEWAKKYWKE